VKSESSLTQRVAKGGMWIFTLRVLENGLRILKLIIVARFLAPHDFGLFGIALLAMSALETFSQTGFQTALVQKKGDIAPYLDTTWTVSIIRGACLFFILFISAPSIALFFKTPEASLIIRVVGATLCVGSFVNSGIVYFQKELEFNKQFLYRLATTLADFIVVAVAAVVWKNVWALVFGLLAGSLAGLVASYMIHPYRPRFRLDVSKTRELFGYGKWVFGSAVLIFLITQGDDVFVGKVLGATMLGFYQMAYRISNMPATEITHVISQVTFPAYAKIQDDVLRLREAYLKVLQLTAFLSFPIAGLIFVLAPDFTRIFLGERWMPMVPAMQVLVVWGFIRSIGATTGPVFFSMGKPEITTKLQLILLILLSIFIYPFSIKWGIFGTSLAVLSATLIPNFVAFFLMIKMTACGVFNFFKMIVFPLISTGFGILVINLLNVYWTNVNTGRLLLSVILSLIVYVCLIYISDKFFEYRFFNNVKSMYSLVH
jgi:lipopolysaccharide exporter